jgi:hypothetical protein
VLSKGIVVLSAWIDRRKVPEELSRELEKKRKKKRFQQFQTVYVYRVEQTSIPTRLIPRTGQHITWMSKSEGRRSEGRVMLNSHELALGMAIAHVLRILREM